MKRDLAAFSGNRIKLLRKIRIVSWYLVQHLIFKNSFAPTIVRPYFLRLFGASIGRRVLIRRGVKIHFPWNLVIGNNCWIGEEVWFINHEKIFVGSDVCISQKSIICSGGHDYRSSSLEFNHKSIEIRNGAWICLGAKVLPGVTIGQCSVIAAGEIARNSIPDYSMLINGQVHTIDFPK
jgi:putative colanic acid biosynthesis acetyltransferase WcaF